MNSDEIIKVLGDTQLLSGLLVAVSVAATIYTIATPFLNTDTLERRMKSVAVERERIRARERAAAKAKGATLRHEHKRYMKEFVERLSLSKWLNTDDAKMRLASAGFRGPQAETAFLFFRAVTPVGLFIAVGAYLGLIDDHGLTWPMELAAAIFGAYVGIKLPELYLTNTIQKRQFSMKRAFPDSLDLMRFASSLACPSNTRSARSGRRSARSRRNSRRSSRSRRLNCPFSRTGARPISILSRARGSTA